MEHRRRDHEWYISTDIWPASIKYRCAVAFPLVISSSLYEWGARIFLLSVRDQICPYPMQQSIFEMCLGVVFLGIYRETNLIICCIGIVECFWWLRNDVQMTRTVDTDLPGICTLLTSSGAEFRGWAIEIDKNCGSTPVNSPRQLSSVPME